MKIAIPLTAGRLSPHFGHCEEFAIIEVDDNSKSVVKKTMHQPPVHEPGVLPSWLSSLGANMIIAGGMGQRAQQLFAMDNITVLVGAPSAEPDQIVSAYLGGTLQTGQNACDH